MEKATVQIVAQGTFSDPSGLAVTTAGAGSGFIISEDGLVVTNNHVVTGAATLNVFVPDRRESVNGRVVATSECADLAIIQLPGGGYPYLEFHEGPLSIGTPIFAAGYPLGEPEYALVAGIISKLDADGETNWASVEQVIQHDAAVSPGNSGGPLVTEEGKVVGIVYAGLLEFNQFFAVGLDQALPVLETLKTGENVEWIGINGEAFVDQGLSGLWVASVESGSPADGAGIVPGDVIVELERLALGDDGTMRDYCDVLRTRGAGRTMQVKVVRYETGEILEGQINGRSLVVTGNVGGEFEGSDQPADIDAPPSVENREYIDVLDDTGRISVTVPSDWEVGTAPYGDTPAIDAAPDLAAWNDSFEQLPTLATVPGIFIAMQEPVNGAPVTEADLQEYLDFGPSQANCFFSTRSPYSDPLYTGFLDEFDCDNGATRQVLAATEDGNPVYIAVIESVAFTDADRDAVQVVYNTFIMYTEGELNGEVVDPDGSTVEYAQAIDDTGQIVANVRTDWAVDGTPIEGPVLMAAPDMDAWLGSMQSDDAAVSAVGIVLGVVPQESGGDVTDSDLEGLLDGSPLPSNCSTAGRFPYSDPIYDGFLQEATCDGGLAYSILVVKEGSNPTYTVFVQSVTVTESDRAAVQEFYDTFIVDPDALPGGGDSPPDGASSTGPDVPGGVVGVLDETGTIFAEVPQPWFVETASVDGFPIIDAAPNLDAWYNSIAGNPGRHVPPYPGLAATDKTTAEVAGIFVTVLAVEGLDLQASDLAAFLDNEPTPSNCTYIQRPFFEGDQLSGQFDESICDHGGVYRIYALLHLDYPNQLIWIEAVTVSADDELAFLHFLATLTVTP